MEEVSVREADIYDARDIYDVMEQVGFLKFLKAGTRQELEQTIIREFIFGKPVRIFVATVPANRFRNQLVVGYSIIGPAWRQILSLPNQYSKEGYAYSKGVGVLPVFQRKKVGEALAAFTANEAQSEGYRGIYTDAASDNTASISFQIQLGMKELARVPDKKRPSGVLSVWFVKEF